MVVGGGCGWKQARLRPERARAKGQSRRAQSRFGLRFEVCGRPSLCAVRLCAEQIRLRRRGRFQPPAAGAAADETRCSATVTVAEDRK